MGVGPTIRGIIIFKQDLYHLAQTLDINLLIAHYPPYCSKYNPIEHRLFSQIHREWKGAVFHRVEVAEELARQTTTQTGVKVRQNLKTYQTQRLVNPYFKENIAQFVQFDQDIPQWNYFIRPQKEEVIF